MVETEVDNQKVLHCAHCGGSFFEENGVNRLTLSGAETLSTQRENDEISGDQKVCPKDGKALQAMDSEAVPPGVTLLKCASCQGVFAYADDLVKFKQAQKTKIDFFKLWSIPVPSMKSVIVMSVAGLISFSLFSTFFRVQDYIVPTQAENVAKNLTVSMSERYLFVSFRTDTPYRSKIEFTHRKTGQKTEKVVVSEPATLHYLTTSDVTPTNDTYYTIVLTDREGKEIRTKEAKLIQ
jgi:hypothetical protein